MTPDGYTVVPIAHIATPFKQKFAIPRQPGLAQALGKITFAPGYDDSNMLKGLEGFSHIWLLFMFHKTVDRGWKSTVKAPRLGGNDTMGVLATRSTHRPNGIGMSVVKNGGVVTENGKSHLIVEGVDLLDGTPVIDIKPYLPYADSILHAHDKLDELNPIPNRTVHFDKNVEAILEKYSAVYTDLVPLIVNVLSQDPRPAYKHKQDNDTKLYKVALYELDIGFGVSNGDIIVTEINPL